RGPDRELGARRHDRLSAPPPAPGGGRGGGRADEGGRARRPPRGDPPRAGSAPARGRPADPARPHRAHRVLQRARGARRRERSPRPRPHRGGAARMTLASPIVEPVAEPVAAVLDPVLDDESRRWLAGLRAEGAERDATVERLHALLLRAARFEVARRRPMLPHLRGGELDEIALEAAGDALMSVVRRLDDFRGTARFTTWAYKFALLEAAVKLRKRSWQGRELPLEPESWTLLASAGLGPDAELEQRSLLEAVEQGIKEALTEHQRYVLVTLALNGVPIDVLADRLDSNRNALYKT